MKQRWLWVFCSLVTLTACHGSLHPVGSLEAADKRPLVECEAQVEIAEGQAIREWQPVDAEFDFIVVVPPFMDRYDLLLRCPGYETAVRSGSWCNRENFEELGAIVLEPQP